MTDRPSLDEQAAALDDAKTHLDGLAAALDRVFLPDDQGGGPVGGDLPAVLLVHLDRVIDNCRRMIETEPAEGGA